MQESWQEAQFEPIVFNFRWKRLNVWRFGLFLCWNRSLNAYFAQLINFFLQPHTWNACQKLRIGVTMHTGMRKMMFLASKLLLYVIHISVLNRLNKVLSHTHSCTKTAPLYLYLYYVFKFLSHTLGPPCSWFKIWFLLITNVEEKFLFCCL